MHNSFLDACYSFAQPQMNSYNWTIMSDSRPTGPSGHGIILGMMILVMAATLGILFLVVDADYRHEKFWLTLATLMLAEGLLIGHRLFRIWQPEFRLASSEMAGGFVLFVWAYMGTVLILAFVAITPIPFKWMCVLHILTFVALTGGWCALSLGRGSLRKIEDQEQERGN